MDWASVMGSIMPGLENPETGIGNHRNGRPNGGMGDAKPVMADRCLPPVKQAPARASSPDTGAWDALINATQAA
ncbi:hypothetical protein GCM10027066_31730 [Dyella jejuensis]